MRVYIYMLSTEHGVQATLLINIKLTEHDPIFL